MAKSPLHDNPRSSKEEKPKEEAAPEKAAEKPAKTEAPKNDDAAETAGEKPAASPKDLFLDGMKAIRKRHESEMRDHHGNHRESMRQMAARHTKEIADHFDMHGAGAEKPASGTPAEGGGEM